MAGQPVYSSFVPRGSGIYLRAPVAWFVSLSAAKTAISSRMIHGHETLRRWSLYESCESTGMRNACKVWVFTRCGTLTRVRHALLVALSRLAIRCSERTFFHSKLDRLSTRTHQSSKMQWHGYDKQWVNDFTLLRHRKMYNWTSFWSYECVSSINFEGTLAVLSSFLVC
jgi:hypothetical protein